MAAGMRAAGEVRFLACAAQTRTLPPAGRRSAPAAGGSDRAAWRRNLTEVLINYASAAAHICGRVWHLQNIRIHSHSVGRFGFFKKNTVSIIMLRVASRGMIILSYYRLPDAAHTFPLPQLEG